MMSVMARTPKGMGPLRRLIKDGKPVGRWFFWLESERVFTPYGLEDKRAAESFRRKYLAEAASGERAVGAENCRIDHLLDLVVEDYRQQGKRSVGSLQSRLKHLRPHLGRVYAAELTERHLQQYRSMRLEVAKPATANRELEVLRRALNLGKRRGLVIAPPHVELMPLNNVRTQRISQAQYRSLIDVLREPERTAAIIAYHIGWRLGAVLGLTWDRVDFDQMVIFPPTEQTSQKAVGQAPIYGDMVQALAKARRDESSYVVHRSDGRPAVDIRKAWQTATRAIGLEDFRFHDLRACAASTLSDAGVPHHEIKRILGHKTDSMFDRYRITSARRLRDIGRQVQQYLEEEEGQEGAAMKPGDLTFNSSQAS